MMSILVNTDGQVCIASDDVYDGQPGSILFNPSRKSLTLCFKDGRNIYLGTSGLSEIARMLHKAPYVRFMQIRKPDAAQTLMLPVTVQVDEALRQAVAI